MTDSIMAIPLLIGVLYMTFFTYKKLRIDLFRDKVFQIRRAMFLIAADEPDLFFKDNSSYRFFESILNATLSYTEDFTLFSALMDTRLRLSYAKKNNIEMFNFANAKKSYLKKIKSPQTRKRIERLMNSFELHYAFFLLTRSVFGLLGFLLASIFIVFFCVVKALYEKEKDALKKSALISSTIDTFKPNRMMSNSQFAYAASGV